MGSKSAKKKQQKGRARPGEASNAGGASSTGSGPAGAADRQGGGAHMTIEELMAAFSSAGDVLDLGGSTVDLSGSKLELCARGTTLANCTIKCRAGGYVHCRPIDGLAPENIRFKNVAFVGSGAGTPARVAAPPGPMENRGGLVVVEGARGVAFQNCTFKNAAIPDAGGVFVAATGLHVADSTVQVDTCRFLNNRGNGLLARGSSTLLVVNNSESSGNAISGACALLGARVDVAGSHLSGNGACGLIVEGAHARATRTACNRNLSSGALVCDGKLALDGCRMSDNAISGIDAQGRGTEVTATDWECAKTGTAGPAACAFGVNVDQRARCTIEKGRVLDHRIGLYVGPGGGSITASDVVCSGGEFGASVLGAGTMRLERVTLRRNRMVGVSVFSQARRGPASSVAGARDVQVSLEGGSITGSRSGVHAKGGRSRAYLKDVSVTRCTSGVEASEGAELVMRGGSVTQNEAFGCCADGPGTVMTVDNVDCARNGRAAAEASHGASVTVDGRVLH